MFADDIVLLTRTDEKNARTIMVVLENFTSWSELKISVEKSKEIFSRNVSEVIKGTLKQIIPFEETLDFGTYLGFPLNRGDKPSLSNFQFLIDEMNSKLTWWKARTLSMAGRLIIATNCPKLLYAGSTTSHFNNCLKRSNHKIPLARHQSRKENVLVILEQNYKE